MKLKSISDVRFCWTSTPQAYSLCLSLAYTFPQLQLVYSAQSGLSPLVIKCNSMFRYRSAKKDLNIKTAHQCFKVCAKFEHFITIVTSQNYIREAVSRRVNLKTAWYFHFRVLLFSMDV
jgi:hypothetical protein